MTRYEYEAQKWNGEVVKGIIDAKSTSEARVKVKNLGYKLLNVDYENYTLFEENKGIIQNFGVENLKIEVKNTENQNISISGLVKINSGVLSHVYVKGTINVETNSDIQIYGLVQNSLKLPNFGRIEFCYTQLEIELTSNSDINNCEI